VAKEWYAEYLKDQVVEQN